MTPSTKSKSKWADEAPRPPEHALFISGRWLIRATSHHNMTIEHWEYVERKASETKKSGWDWKTRGHYSSLGAAINGIARHIPFHAQDLDDIRDQLSELHKEVTRIGI